MPWATILSMLACALATVNLVLVDGWDATYAGLTVAGSVITVCGLLLGVLWWSRFRTNKFVAQRRAVQSAAIGKESIRLHNMGSKPLRINRLMPFNTEYHHRCTFQVLLPLSALKLRHYPDFVAVRP